MNGSGASCTTMGKHTGPARAGNKTYVHIKQQQVDQAAIQKHRLERARHKARRHLDSENPSEAKQVRLSLGALSVTTACSVRRC